MSEPGCSSRLGAPAGFSYCEAVPWMAEGQLGNPASLIFPTLQRLPFYGQRILELRRVPFHRGKCGGRPIVEI